MPKVIRILLTLLCLAIFLYLGYMHHQYWLIVDKDGLQWAERTVTNRPSGALFGTAFLLAAYFSANLLLLLATRFFSRDLLTYLSLLYLVGLSIVGIVYAVSQDSLVPLQQLIKEALFSPLPALSLILLSRFRHLL